MSQPGADPWNHCHAMHVRLRRLTSGVFCKLPFGHAACRPNDGFQPAWLPTPLPGTGAKDAYCCWGGTLGLIQLKFPDPCLAPVKSSHEPWFACKREPADVASTLQPMERAYQPTESIRRAGRPLAHAHTSVPWSSP